MTPSVTVAGERRPAAWWVGSLVVLGALALWEVAVAGIAGTPVYLLPAPSDVAAVLGSDGAGLVPATVTTLLRAVAGTAVGTAFGIGLAVIITFRGHLEQGVMSLALLIKSTQVIAVAPILTIWMGFGHGPK